MAEAAGSIRGRRGYHHGDLRRALIRATLRQIAAKGPHAFTLRESARMTGVTHAASYRHFPGRAALLAAVAEQGFRMLKASVLRSQSGSPNPLKRFQRAGIAYVRFAVLHPEYFRVMFGSEAAGARSASLQRAKDEAFGLVVAGVEACVARGDVRQGATREIALTAWVAMHGLAALLVDRSPRLPRTRASQEDLAGKVTEVLFEGMRTRGRR